MKKFIFIFLLVACVPQKNKKQVTLNEGDSRDNIASAQVERLSVPTTEDALLVNCTNARKIEEYWDYLVDDLQSCFFDQVGDISKSHLGSLNRSYNYCDEDSGRSLNLVPSLDSRNPVLFGDDHSTEQFVISKIDGHECFTFKRKSSETNYMNGFVISKEGEVLFEQTYHSDGSLTIFTKDESYFMSLESRRAFRRTCGSINISGSWGADHKFVGPNGQFEDFTFHMSKSNGEKVGSTCKKGSEGQVVVSPTPEPIPIPDPSPQPLEDENNEYEFFIRVYYGEPVGTLMSEGSGILAYMRKFAERSSVLEVQKVKIIVITDELSTDRLFENEFVRFVKFYNGEPIGDVMDEGDGTLEAAISLAERNSYFEVKRILIRL